MTRVPPVPFWCWDLMGEREVFFAQPTRAGDLTPLPQGACIARCSLHEQVEPGRPNDERTLPIQCGRVATTAPDGDMLCLTCIHSMWTCRVCGAWLPDGPGGCCEACTDGT